MPREGEFFINAVGRRVKAHGGATPRPHKTAVKTQIERDQMQEGDNAAAFNAPTSTALDVFGRIYDEAVPAFITTGSEYVIDRLAGGRRGAPTAQLLDVYALADMGNAKFHIWGPNEVGEAPDWWLDQNPAWKDKVGDGYGDGNPNPFEPAPPRNRTPPTIQGTFIVTYTLTCDPGEWVNFEDEEGPLQPFAYQWKRDGADIVGETASTYTLTTTDDNGVLISCEVTATNDIGSTTVESISYRIETSAAPINTLPPALSGPLGIPADLECSTGNWQSNLPLTYTYQWFRDDAEIVGETTDTYTTQFDQDEFTNIRCEVTATNAMGTTGPVTSNTRTPQPDIFTPTRMGLGWTNPEPGVFEFDGTAFDGDPANWFPDVVFTTGIEFGRHYLYTAFYERSNGGTQPGNIRVRPGNDVPQDLIYGVEAEGTRVSKVLLITDLPQLRHISANQIPVDEDYRFTGMGMYNVEDTTNYATINDHLLWHSDTADSNIAMVNGEYVFNADSPNNALIWWNQYRTNASISCEMVRGEAGSGTTGFFLAGRMSDNAQDFVGVRTFAGNLEVYERIGGALNLLGSVPNPTSYPVRVTLNAVGDQVELRVNEQNVGQWTTARTAQGGWGIASRNGSGTALTRYYEFQNQDVQDPDYIHDRYGTWGANPTTWGVWRRKEAGTRSYAVDDWPQWNALQFRDIPGDTTFTVAFEVTQLANGMNAYWRMNVTSENDIITNTIGFYEEPGLFWDEDLGGWPRMGNQATGVTGTYIFENLWLWVDTGTAEARQQLRDAKANTQPYDPDAPTPEET